MSAPKKFFNIAGPVVPEFHYHLPLRLDYEKIHELIALKFYFILHAPRQTGKTSAIFQLVEKMKENSSSG